jgi:hypothetical protein
MDREISHELCARAEDGLSRAVVDGLVEGVPEAGRGVRERGPEGGEERDEREERLEPPEGLLESEGRAAAASRRTSALSGKRSAT